jgi:hypothetical protein
MSDTSDDDTLAPADDDATTYGPATLTLLLSCERGCLVKPDGIAAALEQIAAATRHARWRGEYDEWALYRTPTGSASHPHHVSWRLSIGGIDPVDAEEPQADESDAGEG